MDERTIEEVLKAVTPGWMTLAEVIGTGIGLSERNEPCIRVFMAVHHAPTERALPRRVSGYPVEVMVTGRAELRRETDGDAPPPDRDRSETP